MLLAALFVGAYVLGSIPFGVLLTRSLGVDVRRVGSGNIGATNVKRALDAAGRNGTFWGLAVFLLDMGKGFAPTFAARWVVPGQELVWFLVGLAAVIGHVTSPFLGFRGGKGVATSLGMVFGAAPVIAAAGFAVFVLTLFVTRYVSLSSIVAVLASVVAGVLIQDWSYVGIGSLLLVFVVWTHRANLARLRAGTESKFGHPAPPTPPGSSEEQFQRLDDSPDSLRRPNSPVLAAETCPPEEP